MLSARLAIEAGEEQLNPKRMEGRAVEDRERISFSLNSGPLRPKVKKKDDGEDVEYVTDIDVEAGIVLLKPKSGSGVRVVPKLENSWRPEEMKMRSIIKELGDAMEEILEMKTVGQNSAERIEGAEASGYCSMSSKELEAQKLREEMAKLPDEATLEQYEELPVEEFGEAVLRGMGWEKGRPIGRNSKTVVKPLELVRRENSKLGLGAVPGPALPSRRSH